MHLRKSEGVGLQLRRPRMRVTAVKEVANCLAFVRRKRRDVDQLCETRGPIVLTGADQAFCAVNPLPGVQQGRDGEGLDQVEEDAILEVMARYSTEPYLPPGS
jgi:hypothetical protein